MARRRVESLPRQEVERRRLLAHQPIGDHVLKISSLARRALNVPPMSAPSEVKPCVPCALELDDRALVQKAAELARSV